MAPQALFNVRTSLAVLGEVLNGTNHLRGVGVLVVVPRHDLNLIGVVVATLNFHDFFVIVHNFETTVTVPQHTVVVPKPACSYQDYTTFRRYFQVLSQFYVLELSYSLYFFLCTYIFMWLSVPLLGASGTRGFRRGVRPAQMRSSAACFAEISPEVILRDGVRNRAIFVWYKTYMPYDPTVASISNRISALGNTPAPIHFTLCIVRHIDYSEPIEHSVDVGYAPDITQRFRTVYHCSDLFYIAQRQQHRAPRQTGRSRAPLCIRRFCLFVFHKRMAGRNRF